jgi:hypothetical protein
MIRSGIILKIALIIISSLLIVAIAIIFLLRQVLKNTFNELIEVYQQIEEHFQVEEALDNFQNGKAYDNQYYPGHLFLSIEPNDEGNEVIQIMDFSLYESNHLIGCVIKYNGLDESFYGPPQQIPGVIVFQPMKGVWSWKSWSQ